MESSSLPVRWLLSSRENDAEAAVFVFEQRDGGVVAVRAGADLAERLPLQRAEDDAQRRAVGEQGDRLAVVRAGDLLQCGEIALKHLPGIFAALGCQRSMRRLK